VPLGGNDIIWGASTHISPDHFYQTVPSVLFTSAEQTYSIYSGFFQDAITLVPNRLTFTMGAKLEHNSFSGFEVQPSGRLAWTPIERQTVWAAITRAVRTPSRIEEGFQFTALQNAALPLFLRLIGDGHFDSEQLVGYELGYRQYIRETAFVDIAAFYNRYDDLLSVENKTPFVETTPTPTHLILPLYFRNGIAAQTKGVEISGVLDIRRWWRLKPSYSYLHLNAERYPTSDDASTVRQLQGDSPQHKVVVQSYFTLPHAFALDLTYRFVSGLPDLKVLAYSTGDVRFAKKIGRGVELSVVGQDLFLPHHPEYAGPPGPLVEVRRSAYLKLVWNK